MFLSCFAKETTMAEEEKKTTEVSEVQTFSGGAMKSVEPIAEVHELHDYSGGEIVEHTTTTLSPILWGFWGIVIVAILGTLVVTGAIPGLHLGSKGYARPALSTNNGYAILEAEQEQMTSSSTSYGGETNQVQYINMSALLLPKGQDLDQAISAGTDIYQNKCIGCHGPNQDGNGPNAINLNPAPRNLRNAPFMQAMSLMRISTSIHRGVPGTAMPRWQGTLSDDQISDVICYVFSLTAPKDVSGKFIHITTGSTNQTGTIPAPAGAM
jgi:mono/diheme cytochrome c family protein